AGRRLEDRAPQPPERSADPPRATAHSPLERQTGRVNPLAPKLAALRVPREEDRDLPGEALAGRRDPEPLRHVLARHVRLLADALRPDHDVRQPEVDV